MIQPLDETTVDPDLVEVRAVLRAHFLAEIVCDHERELDFPQCACASVDLGWHPSIGAAADAWIEHVLAALAEHGALMPTGGETRDGWATEHRCRFPDTPVRTEYASEERARAAYENLRRFTAFDAGSGADIISAALLRRTVTTWPEGHPLAGTHYGPWRSTDG